MTSKLDIVRAGYDKIAQTYTNERVQDSPDVALLQDLIPRLPPNPYTLDAGCGAGIPVTKIMSGVGRVLGVDFSESQIALARAGIPSAEFLCQDLTALDMPPTTFDGIVSYYAIIHIPREFHSVLIQNFYRWLKPNGYALLCLGANDIADDTDAYMGVPMHWSHFDVATNLELIKTAGFTVIWSRVITDFSEPTAGHLFVLAQKISEPPSQAS